MTGFTITDEHIENGTFDTRIIPPGTKDLIIVSDKLECFPDSLNELGYHNQYFFFDGNVTIVCPNMKSFTPRYLEVKGDFTLWDYSGELPSIEIYGNCTLWDYKYGDLSSIEMKGNGTLHLEHCHNLVPTSELMQYLNNVIVLLPEHLNRLMMLMGMYSSNFTKLMQIYGKINIIDKNFPSIRKLLMGSLSEVMRYLEVVRRMNKTHANFTDTHSLIDKAYADVNSFFGVITNKPEYMAWLEPIASLYLEGFADKPLAGFKAISRIVSAFDRVEEWEQKETLDLFNKFIPTSSNTAIEDQVGNSLKQGFNATANSLRDEYSKTYAFLKNLQRKNFLANNSPNSPQYTILTGVLQTALFYVLSKKHTQHLEQNCANFLGLIDAIKEKYRLVKISNIETTHLNKFVTSHVGKVQEQRNQDFIQKATALSL